MSIAWGEFEDMSIHYLRELAKRGTETPMLFSKELEQVWGVCTYAEFAEMQKLSGVGMYRPVCAASADEWMGLMFARFIDFMEVSTNADEEKNIQAGEQPSPEHTNVDAGAGGVEKGGHSNDNGSQGEENNSGTVN